MLSIPEVELTAIADFDEHILAENQPRYGVRSYRDYRDMLEKERPDVVGVLYYSRSSR